MIRAARLLLPLLLLAGCYKTDLAGVGYRYGLPLPEVHIVQRGETLYGIGRHYGIDYHLLIRRNHIRPPYTIYVGQRIYLTRPAPASIAPLARQYHRVARQSGRGRRADLHRRARHAGRKGAVRSSRKGRRRAAVGGGVRRTMSGERRAVAVVPLRWPAEGPVTSGFGRRGSRMHDGIDIGARPGSPVVAAADGTVVYASDRLAGYGNLIIIRHRDNLFTAYAHNQRNLVRRGDVVHAGQRIALVGRTGRATGPHLHFEVRRGTTPVDPLLYLPPRR
ncbi:MAG: M23 family metallopeptidase [Zetaproteobacteria bacterium]|nr:MAG: M23 family metallopeptidase [Zetaproteobacteria bacterium]